jgi:signal transduction histidine kinase
MGRWWTGRARHSGFLQRLRGPILLAVAYYAGAQAAFLIGTLSDRIFAPFWPPNIVLFCALMLVPYRQWPVYLMAVLPAHVAAELSVGMNWPQILIAFVTNCAVATLNAFGVRYLVGRPPWLDTFHKALIYVLVTAVIGPAAVAFGGAFVRIAGGGDPQYYLLFWEEWYAANALASVTLGVVLLARIGKRDDWLEFTSRSRRREALCLAASLALACAIAFSAGSLTIPSYVPAVLYLPLPMILWAAIRFRTVGASAAILVVTITSISLTSKGLAVFAGADAEANVLALQLFLVAISVPTLFLGACVDGLRRAEGVAAKLAQIALSTQDDERRRVANGLHDGIAQHLVAAIWIAERVREHLPQDEQRHARELEGLLQKCVIDIRSLSYVLHPPLLDEEGLEAALRSRVESYRKSSGISVDLEVARRLGRLPPQVELTIFRLVEEALSNIRQHSDSPTARVLIERNRGAAASHVNLTIEDQGKGMASMGNGPAKLQDSLAINISGLGLSRMRERLKSIGGKLAVQSTVGRTIIRATIPLNDDAPDCRCEARGPASQL